MHFRTKIEIPTTKFKISHHTKITCLGSCFAEHIGEKLMNHKMDILCNPTGIIYNPASLANTIDRAIINKDINEDNLFIQQGRWVHYDFHSSMSSSDKHKTTNTINTEIHKLYRQLIGSDVLIISLGTAFVFKLIDNKSIVNNCHKMPNTLFERVILSLTEVKSKLEDIINKLIEINPKLNIITTISPVRHIRDGLIQNQRSKSTLHLAIQELNDKYEQLYYFPSYEILLDELRDYRYYDRDMLHPSKVAIDYIWDLFSTEFFSDKTIQLNKKIQAIKNAMEHRPFNPNSNEHKEFKESQLKKIETLLKEEKTLNLEKEILFFNS